MNTQSFQMINLSVNDLMELITNCLATELQKVSDLKTQNQKPDSDEILSREQTKDLLKTSYVSLWKYNKMGILKAKKIGSKVYYLRQDVFNLLNNVA